MALAPREQGLQSPLIVMNPSLFKKGSPYLRMGSSGSEVQIPIVLMAITINKNRVGNSAAPSAANSAEGNFTAAFNCPQ